MNNPTPSHNITEIPFQIILSLQITQFYQRPLKRSFVLRTRHSDSGPVALPRRRTASSKDTAKAVHLEQTKMEMPKSAVI